MNHGVMEKKKWQLRCPAVGATVLQLRKPMPPWHIAVSHCVFARNAGVDIGKSIHERLGRAVTVERCYDIVSAGDDKIAKRVATGASDGIRKGS